MDEARFSYPVYVIRRKVLRLFGGAFHVFDPSGAVVFYARMKAFKLREDLRLYSDEGMQTEALAITARQILDVSATYDVVDPPAKAKVGALRRKGLKSMLRDEWLILDPNDREIGVVREDSLWRALMRRFLMNLIPQTYRATMDGVLVCTFRRNFNPFVTKITVDFTADAGKRLDRRLGLAAGLLLCAVEGRQG